MPHGDHKTTASHAVQKRKGAGQGGRARGNSSRRWLQVLLPIPARRRQNHQTRRRPLHPASH
eukprot:7385161-Prymnesium_polylepis.2